MTNVYTSSTGTHRIGDSSNYVEFAYDGELGLAGTARVYKNEWILPGAFQAPGTKPAASVEHGLFMAWEFSDNTDDTLTGVIRLPQDMDRTDAPQFKIGWDSDTADPGNNSKQATWQLEYLYRAQNEDVTAGADDTLSATTSASTTTNGLTITTITGMAAPEATDQLLIVRIKRLGAADSLGDVAYLDGCGLRYTANKLGVGT